MTKFIESDAGVAFINSGDSRETDRRIMEAIAFFALNEAEAEAFWNGDFGGKCDYMSIWEHATNNGLLDAADMPWGQTNLAVAVAGF
ncbi:MAG: hypothetical protein PHT60_16510 [Acidiphilium sp.]|nr:hypothetical protein [Acidiphilium sp.]MDD4937367.1 hypothetical protein [Acidiphilium sp.]